MSELRADSSCLPTEQVVNHIQTVLSRFASQPEGYSFQPMYEFVDDTFRVSFEGIGAVLLNYDRHRSQRLVSFRADEGFEVNTGFRIIAGRACEPIPIPFDQRGGLHIRYQATNDMPAATYYPKQWEDNGCSFHARHEKVLHWEEVDYIGHVVSLLPEPFSQPHKPDLSVVK